MKKLLTLLLTIILSVTLVACAGGSTPDAAQPDTNAHVISEPDMTPEEAAAAVDEFIAENSAFLRNEWVYLTSGEINSGAISKLPPDRLIDITSGTFGDGASQTGGVDSLSVDEGVINGLEAQYAPLFYTMAWGTDSLQQAFDRFYGKGRYDVTTWTGDGRSDEVLVHDNNTSVLLTLGMGGGSSRTLLERAQAKKEGDEIIATCYAVTYYEYFGEGIAVNDMGASQEELAFGLDWSVADSAGSLDEFLKAASIGRDALKPIRLIFHISGDSLYLSGVER